VNSVSPADEKKVILVVDDAPDEIAVMDAILKKDFRVRAATNGAAAIAIARSERPPDLVLLDVCMPDMDGFEVCRALKQDSVGATIPVIFLTSRSESFDEKTGFELGAVDYIRKPVDPEIVRQRIYSHLETREQALRSSELRYRRLFEAASDGILMLDARSGAFIDANPALAAMLGLSQEAFLGRMLADLPMLDGIVPLERPLAQGSRPRYLRHEDRPIETADGRGVFVESIYGAYQVDNREVIQVNLRDISALVLAKREREKSRVLLEASLREKEALLQEIHHRVKNNLQIIISLLHVSSHGIEDAAVRERIADVTDRLYSMAAIHEQFYGSVDISSIDFALCLRQLADDSMGRSASALGRIELDCAAGEAILSLEQALPAGLIVAEFLSLASRAAAGGTGETGREPAGEPGRRAAVLRQRLDEDGLLEISLCAAAPSGSAAEEKGSALGRMLLEALSGQLGAETAINRDGGFNASLRFAIEKPQRWTVPR
jgi:PAS domain S-box-containing protein